MRAVRSVLVATSMVLAGACGDDEITVENLEGTWNATAYVYTNTANTSQTVDIVDVDGASLTLTVQANGTTTSTFDDGKGGSSSNSGSFTASGQMLTLAGVTYDASLSGNTLTLTTNDAEYDFDNDGSKDPASLRITLTRQ